MLPVYILARTSNRPLFFKAMMDSIKKQTYKNIVTIIHSDDPRDEYVTGDIILQGAVYPPDYGNGTYNLYNNRLLQAIPIDKPGYFHFIDDDDEYASDDVIEKLVASSKKDCVNVEKVERWNKTVWPKNWGVQKSYQTECFFLHTDYKKSAKWWGHTGGDHHYSKQLTKFLPINWIDNLLICKAQEGKGHGRKLDKGGKETDFLHIDQEKYFCVMGMRKYRKGLKSSWINPGEIKSMKFKDAIVLEKEGIIKFTYGKNNVKPAIKQIYKI